jgi:hypothetical protein
MSSGTKFRCGLDGAHPRASLSQKPDHIGLFGTKTTQNPDPHLGTNPRPNTAEFVTRYTYLRQTGTGD